ncbi:BolA family protein [Paracoccaceae bacterium Fryx2]|nr:BolA family protein [Paracoccaceae bacterium Fryx2]
MRAAEEIRDRLQTSFQPDHLEVIDESEQHRGHGGWQEGGETHFRVILRAPAFAPMSRLARHRAVHAALGPALVGRIHALSLEIC